jgi:hypothetical protein
MKKIILVFFLAHLPPCIPAQQPGHKPLTGEKICASVFLPGGFTGYALCESGCILTTSNGGVAWSTFTDKAGYYLSLVYFSGPDTGYAVGNGLAVMKITTASLSMNALYTTITGGVRSSSFRNLPAGQLPGIDRTACSAFYGLTGNPLNQKAHGIDMEPSTNETTFSQVQEHPENMGFRISTLHREQAINDIVKKQKQMQWQEFLTYTDKRHPLCIQ